MKKLITLIAVGLSIVLMSAMPAQAASLRVSASAKAHAAGVASHVDFRAKVSRPSRVKVTVYKGTKQLRAMTAKKSGSAYVVSWNLRDAKGKAVKAGVYAYKVTALASRTSKSVRGRVRAPAPTPAPVSATIPSGRFVGFYISGNLSDTTGLNAVESEIGTRAVVVNMFLSDSEAFPTDRCQTLGARGSIPLVTLEFWSTQSAGVDSITNGSKDAYLTAFADKAKAYGKEVRLRPFHELNGDWYPWCGTVGPNTPAKVVAAWKHVHDIFVREGATNVKFVWCINADNCPNTTANKAENFWPGDGYVDYVAIDGYNFGTYASWSTWRSFGSIIGGAYQHIVALTSKPMFIAETGCVEQGGNKSAWIADMFHSINTTYTRIQGICWFNVHDGEDWRIESSSSSLNAFASAAKAGY